MRFHPPLPPFPAFPTAPMAPATYRDLLEALRQCRPMQAYPEAHKHVMRGYARLWAHVALEHQVDPRQVISPANGYHRTVVRVFLDAGRELGLHDRYWLTMQIPEIAAQACILWREAKEAQVRLCAPGLGLEGSAK